MLGERFLRIMPALNIRKNRTHNSAKDNNSSDRKSTKEKVH
jgi:hypothetical protein